MTYKDVGQGKPYSRKRSCGKGMWKNFLGKIFLFENLIGPEWPPI